MAVGLFVFAGGAQRVRGVRGGGWLVREKRVQRDERGVSG